MSEKFNQMSNIQFTKDFIAVSASSLGSLWFFEYTFKPIILTIDCSNELLGSSVFEALSHSRKISSEEFHELFNSGFLKTEYINYINCLMNTFNYKNQRQLYKTMRKVSVVSNQDCLEISPTHQNSLGGFSGIEEIDSIITPFDIKPDILGEKIRIAHQLSTSIYK